MGSHYKEDPRDTPCCLRVTCREVAAWATGLHVPVRVHALVEHTDHVNATSTDDVEDDMASDGAAPVTGTNLVSGVPSTGIVCEALQTRLKITQIDLGLLPSPAFFAVVPDT